MTRKKSRTEIGDAVLYNGDTYIVTAEENSGTCDGCHFQVVGETCFVHIYSNLRSNRQAICGINPVIFKPEDDDGR